MFRPNRIGTPYIHDSDGAASTADFTLSDELIASSLFPSNVINASPALDFQRSAISWVGTEAVAALNRFCFGQQFTITQPLDGDTVGLELSGAIRALIPASASIRPRLNKMTAAQAAIFASDQSADIPTYFAEPYNGLQGDDDLVHRAWFYKESIVVRGSSIVLPGTYLHGFEIENNGAGFNLTSFDIHCSVRQLNDQQSIGYRDTLR